MWVPQHTGQMVPHGALWLDQASAGGWILAPVSSVWFDGWIKKRDDSCREEVLGVPGSCSPPVDNIKAPALLRLWAVPLLRCFPILTSMCPETKQGEKPARG